MRNGGVAGPERRRGRAPSDDLAVGPPFANPSTGGAIGEPSARSRATSPGDVVGGERERREPLAPGVEQRQARPDRPRRPRSDATSAAIEHADELEVRVAEEREPVERPARLVPAAAGEREAEVGLERRGRPHPGRGRR